MGQKETGEKAELTMARTRKMTILRNLQTKLGGLAVWSFVRGWMSTLDYQALFYDRTVNPAREDFEGPVIFTFWHEYIPCPIYLHPNCNVAMLLSRHRDAEWLSQAARFMGFEAVRGSTKRGGDAALRELSRVGQVMNLGITPDGPRGPRRRLAAGCIYLSSKMGIPLVPFGVGYHKPWRMPTWDRFAIPRPYSRVRLIAGPHVQIPPKLNRDEIEGYRERTERMLNRLTAEAESWADSGERRCGQIPCLSQPAPLRSRVAESVQPDTNLIIFPSPEKRCA
jgi:lysophospholipid acyltransferase (LPLAT)-like uncharacterized protein